MAVSSGENDRKYDFILEKRLRKEMIRKYDGRRGLMDYCSDPFVWDSVCGTEGGAEYPSVDLLFLRVVLVLSDLCGKISE